MTDAIQAIADWISKEPEATEIIIIRRRGGRFHVKMEYGDRTTVPAIADDLAEALTKATDLANRNPSSARFYAERDQKKPTFMPKVEQKKPKVMMPGAAPKRMPGC
jgi:cobalamin-dependent methionine synthase I